jgi:hypothetical protein
MLIKIALPKFAFNFFNEAVLPSGYRTSHLYDETEDAVRRAVEIELVYY